MCIETPAQEHRMNAETDFLPRRNAIEITRVMISNLANHDIVGTLNE